MQVKVLVQVPVKVQMQEGYSFGLIFIVALQPQYLIYLFDVVKVYNPECATLLYVYGRYKYKMHQLATKQ